MLNCRLRNSSGGALVELALTSPMFLVLIMGSFEIGRMAHFGIEVENAARAGASYGAQNIGNASSATVVQAAKNDAPDLGDLQVSSGSACVCETLTVNGSTMTTSSGATVACNSPTILACTTESSTSNQVVVSYVTVSTSATINTLFQLPVISKSFTLHGYSALRVLTN